MSERLRMRIGEELAVIELFLDKAPNMCKKLLESLPIRSHAIIAKVAGLELMVRVPYFVDTDPENVITAQKPGNVCFNPDGQNVCIFCAELRGLGPISWIGTIVENLPGVIKEAKKCMKKQGAEVNIYK